MFKRLSAAPAILLSSFLLYGCTGAEAGPAGERGRTGPTGAMGSSGVQGPTGQQGPTGPQGAQGEAATFSLVAPLPDGGSVEIDGGVVVVIGPMGPTGLTGETGFTGMQGLAGPQGPLGPIGPAGISVLSEVELPGENCPTGGVKLIAAEGTTYACNGAVGAQGIAGPVGPTGIQGPIGVTGAEGVAGPVGPEGKQGPMGVIGLTGATGAEGPQGLLGPVGVEGPQGPMGKIGLTGATGAQGPIGPDGVQGMMGLTGATGPTGSTGGIGPQGIAGPTGPAGQEGPEGKAVVGASEPVGLNCPTGGVRLMSASGSAYVCNGPMGPEGIEGVQGNTGPAGIQGPAGVAGPAGAVGPAGSGGFSVYDANNVKLGTLLTTPGLRDVTFRTSTGYSLTLNAFDGQPIPGYYIYYPNAGCTGSPLYLNGGTAGASASQLRNQKASITTVYWLGASNQWALLVNSGSGYNLGVSGVVTSTGYNGNNTTPCGAGTPGGNWAHEVAVTTAATIGMPAVIAGTLRIE